MIPFTVHCARCGAPMRACACTGAMLMAPPPPDPPKTIVARFKKFGAYTYCELCGLELAYCKGHTLPDLVPGDGAESSLEQRAREAQTR